MYKKLLKPLFVATAIVVSTTAHSNSLENDLVSSNIVERNIGKTEQTYNIYARYGNGRLRDDRANYWHLFHGEGDDGFSLMNKTGLLINNKESKNNDAIFLAFNKRNNWLKFTPKELNNLSAITSIYQNIKPEKERVSLGFDTGAAVAYSFGCENKMEYVVMVMGGLGSLESCSPKNQKTMLILDKGDTKYPYSDRESLLVDGGSSMFNRLDGKSTVLRLKNRLGCEDKGITVEKDSGVVVSYSCKYGNSLVTVDTNGSNHTVTPELSEFIGSELDIM